ncbi:FecR family protein [Pedobacter nyackensis]|uniref:FecR family protein n=1 Tax=Pedobacter nyackensis TaxID=475255 RepID=UPI0029304126|nr:FecR domain-containing protein [Pedobacter nyackensis]
MNLMANQEHLNALIKQFTEGIISKEDYVELMAHFKSDKDTDEVLLAMDRAWTPEHIDDTHSPEEMDTLYHKLASDKRFKKTYKFKIWPKIAVAASVAIALSVGLWFFIGERMINTQSKMVSKNDISPGRNTATLILSNGKHINLSDAKTGVVIDAAKLSYNDGTEIKEAVKADAMLTITTPPGGTYHVRLSDGTNVWLNALSTLTFSSTFTRLKQREVGLTGEAYFEVEKDPLHPFVVRSATQEVVVLGTHFNISNYADEYSIKTTLLEGSVKVSRHNSPVSSLLKPGMQSTFTSSGIKIQQLEDPEEAIAWKSGYFTFNREPLDQVMRKVSRWYNVKVIYNDESIKNIPFSGTITRFAQASELLKMLELTGKVQFKIVNENIIADKK